MAAHIVLSPGQLVALLDQCDGLDDAESLDKLLEAAHAQGRDLHAGGKEAASATRSARRVAAALQPSFIKSSVQTTV